MRAIVKGKNVEVPDRVRLYAERKLARIERLLDDRSDAIVEIWSEQHRSVDDSHIVEVTLLIDGQTLRSRATGPTYQAGIDHGDRQGRTSGDQPQAATPPPRTSPGGEATPESHRRRHR